MISYKESSNITHSEQLHIDLGKRNISSHVRALKFIDKDTKQHVMYLPSFEISGYGATIEKASEMVKCSVTDFFSHLLSLSPQQIQTELSELGWKKNLLEKNYSRPSVEGDSSLQNINAKDNKIELVTLIAA